LGGVTAIIVGLLVTSKMPMPTGRDRAANAPAASLRGVTRQANLQALEVDKTMIMGVLDSSGPRYCPAGPMRPSFTSQHRAGR
jgi:hypothetical protein